MKKSSIIVIMIIIAITGYLVYRAMVTPKITAPPISETSEISAGKYVDVTPLQAKNLIDTKPDLIVIDVSPDYDAGHLPGAVSYYLGGGFLDTAIPMLNKDGEYLVYCHFESASRAGAQKLVDAGFKNVYRLAGEYDAWVAAGYPVE